MDVAESPFNVAHFFLEYDELGLAVEKSTPRTFRRSVAAWLQHLDGLPDLVRPIFQRLEASANVNHWMLQYLGVSPVDQVRGPIQLPTGRWERLGTQLAILRLWVKDDETAAGFLNNIGPKGKSEQEGYRAIIDQFFLPTQRELRRFMWDEISHLEPPMILRPPQMDIKSAEITLSDVPPANQRTPPVRRRPPRTPEPFKAEHFRKAHSSPSRGVTRTSRPLL